MKEIVLTLGSLADVEPAAVKIAEAIRANGDQIVAFYGEMGAGKTTFISALAAALGADADEANSPSFSIVNEYALADGGVIYHFDLYRLESPQDGLDIGIEDYFDSGSLCLLEWPERIGGLLPEDAARIEIDVADDAERTRRLRYVAGEGGC